MGCGREGGADSASTVAGKDRGLCDRHYKAGMQEQGRESVVLNLYNTLYIPQANVCLFSLQKMREAHYRIVELQPIGTDWIQSEKGLFAKSMCVDQEGRAVVNCRTLLPLPSPSIQILLPVKAIEEV